VIREPKRACEVLKRRLVVLSVVACAAGTAFLSLPAAAQRAASKAQIQRIQAAQPASADDAFLAMREAIKVGDLDGAAALGQRVLNLDPNYPLAAYIDYWPLSQRLHSVNDPPPDDTVRAFLAQNEGTLVADYARRDWLLALGRRGDFANFDLELPKLQNTDDAQVGCYALASRYVRTQRGGDGWNETASSAASTALSVPANINGEGCALLLSLLSADNRIPESQLWDWVRLASDANLPVAMKRYALALPTADTQAVLAFDAINSNAALWLTRHGEEHFAGSKELWDVALTRMARASPSDTASLFEAHYAQRMAPRSRAVVYAELAGAGFKRQLPDALEWARKGLDARIVPEDVYASELRVALRDADYKLYRALYERLPAEMKRNQSNEGGWTYWLARIEQKEGHTQAANELLQAIAGQFNFYGQLATEELGQPITIPGYAVPANDAEVALAASQPAFARAQRFYALNMRPLGNYEWNFPLKNMTDRQLLASAEYARRIDLLDRAVNTADRTHSEHDFRLRFLAPYLDSMRAKTTDTNLDLAWVYGLIRQESRFVQVARSSVGASGLMQLMPGTAKYVAKKIGLTDYSPERVNDLDTNLTLGTGYLRLVLDQLDNIEVLATAAYNAGPGRARNWRQTLARSEEGALFAETIPFPETRDYVKKVMSNTIYYGLVLQPNQRQSLKVLMGTIGSDPSEPPLPPGLP
jgi:soluble lytic murein transglycosylase